MRDHAGVSRRQLRTSNYSEDARHRLGKAVEEARIAAGYKYRPGFISAHGIKNMRGLELLETGSTGVGQAFLFEIADALPGWTRETPRLILEGEDPPPIQTTLDQAEEASDADVTDSASGEEDETLPPYWTAKQVATYHLFKDRLLAQGLALTPPIFEAMQDQYEIEMQARRAAKTSK